MGVGALTILYPSKVRSPHVDAHAFPGADGAGAHLFPIKTFSFDEVSQTEVPAGYAPLAHIYPFQLCAVDVAVGSGIFAVRLPILYPEIVFPAIACRIAFSVVRTAPKPGLVNDSKPAKPRVAARIRISPSCSNDI